LLAGSGIHCTVYVTWTLFTRSYNRSVRHAKFTLFHDQKTSKLSCNLMKMLQLLGDFIPQTHAGVPPLDPAGGLPSPDPRTNLFPLCPQPLWAGDATAAEPGLAGTRMSPFWLLLKLRMINADRMPTSGKKVKSPVVYMHTYIFMKCRNTISE